MVQVDFPEYGFKIKKDKGRDVIFDECRKIWVILTPEEWVRQNFLQYMIQVKKYPASLIAVEREITLGDLKKRFDIVVYKEAKPWMIVECKEASVQLGEPVIKQILNYNITLRVDYLVITNGAATYALYLQEGRFEWLESLPEF